MASKCCLTSRVCLHANLMISFHQVKCCEYLALTASSHVYQIIDARHWVAVSDCISVDCSIVYAYPQTSIFFTDPDAYGLVDDLIQPDSINLDNSASSSVLKA